MDEEVELVGMTTLARGDGGEFGNDVECLSIFFPFQCLAIECLSIFLFVQFTFQCLAFESEQDSRNPQFSLLVKATTKTAAATSAAAANIATTATLAATN